VYYPILSTTVYCKFNYQERSVLNPMDDIVKKYLELKAELKVVLKQVEAGTIDPKIAAEKIIQIRGEMDRLRQLSPAKPLSN
jgi:hypothetical protein